MLPLGANSFLLVWNLFAEGGKNNSDKVVSIEKEPIPLKTATVKSCHVNINQYACINNYYTPAVAVIIVPTNGSFVLVVSFVLVIVFFFILLYLFIFFFIVVFFLLRYDWYQNLFTLICSK